MTVRNTTVAGLLGVVLMSGCSVRSSSTRTETGPVVVAPAPGPVVVAPAPKGPPPHAPAHGQRRNFAYTYYPDVEVYFAPERGSWFWLEHGEWRVGVELPRHFEVRLGGSVSINLDCERPYERHTFVTASHPGRKEVVHADGHDNGRHNGKGNGKGKAKGHAGAEDR